MSHTQKTILAVLLILLGLVLLTLTISKPEESKPQLLRSVSPNTFAMTNETETHRTVIDVRTEDEFNQGHLPDAQLIDFYSSDFAEKLDALDKNAAYALYCRSGNRSTQALGIMTDMGFSDVIELDGGIVAWKAEGKDLCDKC